MKPQHRRSRLRTHARHIVTVFIVAFSTVLTVRASAESGQTAAQVADEIVAVQAQADDVAAQWVQRDADAKDLAVQVDAATQAVAQATATTQAMGQTLTKLAIDRYTGTTGGSFLPFSDEVMTDLQMAALSGFASNSGAADLDAFQAAETDLRDKQQTLGNVQAQNNDALTKLSDTQSALDRKLAELTTIEAKLKDAEVKQAYEAKLAALRAKQAAAADAAQAALRAKATPAVVVRGGATAEPAAPAATNQPTVTTAAAQQLVAGTAQPTGDAPADALPATTKPAAPTQPTVPKPEPAPAPQPAVGGLVCPVAGPNAFGDSWGDPRPGGRHHEGVDMMSPQGTPLVAVIGGTATMKTNALGGITVGLTGNDGNYYYYAHLSSWEGSSRQVAQGEVIGYVGHTGDTSANHLHFGVYAGGGPAINPYPIVRRVC
ncbi:MAG: peptidoglycan DD-metalloendopeptidase family protein [Ilumatobacteraceae bacterium]